MFTHCCLPLAEDQEGTRPCSLAQRWPKAAIQAGQRSAQPRKMGFWKERTLFLPPPPPARSSPHARLSQRCARLCQPSRVRLFQPSRLSLGVFLPSPCWLPFLDHECCREHLKPNASAFPPAEWLLLTQKLAADGLSCCLLLSCTHAPNHRSVPRCSHSPRAQHRAALCPDPPSVLQDPICSWSSRFGGDEAVSRLKHKTTAHAGCSCRAGEQRKAQRAARLFLRVQRTQRKGEKPSFWRLALGFPKIGSGRLLSCTGSRSRLGWTPQDATRCPPGSLTSFCLSSLKLECDKLASEKSEMQRHYVMVRSCWGRVWVARVGSRCCCCCWAHAHGAARTLGPGCWGAFGVEGLWSWCPAGILRRNLPGKSCSHGML